MPEKLNSYLHKSILIVPQSDTTNRVFLLKPQSKVFKEKAEILALRVDKKVKDLFKKYKSVVRFVGLFLGSYILLSVLYSFYLKFSESTAYFPDFITHLVALQSNSLLSGLGYGTAMTDNPVQDGISLTLDNIYSVLIVEGCNSISVIILFVSFIIAFAQNFRKTFLFICAGAVLLYAINIIRIGILAVAMYKLPQYDNVLHSVVFPGIIYGMVFLLWMLWVKMLPPKTTE